MTTRHSESWFVFRAPASSNMVGKIKFNSSEISWKKEKNEYGDVILIVRIKKKGGSNLEPRVEDSLSRLQSLFEG